MAEACWQQAPAGWPRPTGETVAGARRAVLEALTMVGLRPADGRLLTYYDERSEQPGTLFTDVAPVCPDRFTAADLYAVGLLGVPVSAGAARRLLGAEADTGRLDELLAAVPPGRRLRTAEPAQLTEMARLHAELELVLSGVGAGVGAGEGAHRRQAVASALCARKRPHLFPVRRAGVRELLGVASDADPRVDWQVYRGLLQDRAVEEACAAAVEAACAARPSLRVDASWLRLLDVVLATHLEAGALRASRRIA